MNEVMTGLLTLHRQILLIDWSIPETRSSTTTRSESSPIMVTFEALFENSITDFSMTFESPESGAKFLKRKLCTAPFEPLRAGEMESAEKNTVTTGMSESSVV